jgi:CRP/FNR family transcriptional regulator, cyclic AMP receptor protein
MDAMALYKKLGRVFPAGTVLFREGDLGGEMFIIQSGRVQISRRVGAQEAVLAVLPAGEFFGEMSIVNNRPRSATATVLEEATLLVIDARTFEAMIRGSTEIAMRMIKKLADRLDQADRQIEMLLYREPNHRVVHFLRGQAETYGMPHAAGTAIHITELGLAERVGLPIDEVRQVVDRLVRARLLARAEDGASLVVFEVGKLQEFLDFLEMKERFGAPQQ